MSGLPEAQREKKREREVGREEAEHNYNMSITITTFPNTVALFTHARGQSRTFYFPPANCLISCGRWRAKHGGLEGERERERCGGGREREREIER